jgi:diguanylate cyclase (GGDEF)-like protein
MDKPFALIVEDDLKAGALFRHALSLAGFEAETVFHGRFALERLARSRPWLVILDLDMPGVSGDEFLRIIRNDDRLHQIKVIAITSYSQIAESLSAEPDLLLFKPVGMEQVSDFIARFQLKLKYQTTIPMLGEPWDRVTGLYNQSFFAGRLENALLQARETGQFSFAVLTVSIDPDNSIRDRLDIRSWIAVLRETAETLKFAARPTDIIARFDQDNFYVLIESIPNGDMLVMIASRIRKKLEENLAALGNRVQFPIRVAILQCDRRYENIEEILRDADAAPSLQLSQKEAFLGML